MALCMRHKRTSPGEFHAAALAEHWEMNEAATETIRCLSERYKTVDERHAFVLMKQPRHQIGADIAAAR